LLAKIDEQTEGEPGFWRATVAGRTIMVITDQHADRRRIISAVAKAQNLKPELLVRMLQANFDTALVARYSIAKKVFWSLYLHPLSSLSAELFLTGVGQVVIPAASFGSTYSSGGLSFGGGDSNPLIQELLDKGRSI